MSAFVHLHVHTEYSLSDSTVRIAQLLNKAVEDEMAALAITDLSNVYGVVKFYKACMNAGIKPLIGTEVWVENPIDNTVQDKFVLLAQNNQGYEQICQLLTESILHNKHLGKSIVTQEKLATHSSGLIALHHSSEGELMAIIQHGEEVAAQSVLAHYMNLFSDRLYMEVSRVGLPDETANQSALIALATKLSIPLVAVNRVQFIEPDDYSAHEVRVCIHDGRQLGDPRRVKKFTEAQYFKPQARMCKLFADLPEAIENTLHIARRCNVFFTFGKDYLPNFPGSGEKSAEQVLQENAQAGLAQRLKQLPDNVKFVEQDYQARLKLELDVIIQMGFPGYFLIVADFIQWSREHAVPVGPGRGSGAGSVVAWALKITDLDPLQFGLLFERFLNPERVSMPDFDIDFCMEGRDRVIEYVAECYGRDQVAQIITFGTMAAKAVIRDVGRVLGHGYGYVDSIAKLIPFEVGITLEKAFEQEKELQARYDEDEEAAELLDMAKQLEGLSRNVGKHAGGVVIAPTNLTQFTALYAESADAQAVTQFDKDDLESIGLVKFDFLGLRTLTVIDWAVALVNKLNRQSGQQEIVLPQQAFYDDMTFNLIKKGQTIAVFQLESSGMRDLILRLQPDCFEDLIALVALYRPGPLDSGMVESYVNRKHGRESVEFPHPDTASILGETNGVILYQEQVMQIAQVLAGYSLGAADLLRRAMGKKKPEEMAKQRTVFVAGAEKNNIESKTAEYIFDMMETFAGYGFNKSHSAAYALLSFQTAWLKAHYPAAYMAATMSADMDNTDKIVGLIADARNIGLLIQFPDINRSLYKFEPIDEQTVMYGLGAIKGLGESAIEIILLEREDNGSFQDIHDFCKRVVSRKVNKRAIEAVIRAGGFDAIEANRAQVLADLPSAIEIAEQNNQNKNAGQRDLFGLSMANVVPQKRSVPTWNEIRRLSEEREALGLYLSGHPFDYYRRELETISDMQRCQSVEKQLANAVIAGMIVNLRIINTRRGDKMAFVSLDDGVSRVEVSLFSELYGLCRPLLGKDKILIVTGELKRKEGGKEFEMIAQSASDIAGLRQEKLQAIRILVKSTGLDKQTITRFKKMLSGYLHRGDVLIEMIYQRNNGVQGLIQFSEEWKVNVCDELFDEISSLFGVSSIQYIYDAGEIRNGLTFKAPPPRFNYNRRDSSKPHAAI
jgi:DNA polymerase-3 subunit alpha